MPTLLIQTLRSRWFAWCVHLGLWWLFFVIVAHLGTRSLDLSEARAYSTTPQFPVPVSKLGGLFATVSAPATAVPSNALNPFFTRYFEPAPAPPAPSTRKVDVIYLGFYEASESPKHAMLKLADAFVAARIGSRITTNYFVAEATMQSVTLTNVAGQTNVVPLNRTNQIEVPLK